MTDYRARLPQLEDRLFLTDGGLETWLIFQKGFELPCFASFVLLADEAGRDTLVRYYETYVRIGVDAGAGVVLDTPTWRASRDWGARLGYDAEALDRVNRESVQLLQPIRDRYQTATSPIVIAGSLGPKGDGYDPSRRLTVDEAEAYHGPQIEAFASCRADLVSAMTMTHCEEAIGVARAAASREIPVSISFTVETDGCLPTGEALGDAIARVDDETSGAPAYYMLNCAHPVHFDRVLRDAAGSPWIERLRGMRVNASLKSHAELDESSELDDGNPEDLALRCRRLHQRLPQISILGGCCGTDERHVAAIASSCREHGAAA